MPIDIAGTTPSLKTVDTLLEHYSKANNLPAPRKFHNDFSTVEKFMDYETECLANSKKRTRAGNYVTKGEQDLEVDFEENNGEEIGFQAKGSDKKSSLLPVIKSKKRLS